MTDRSRDDDPEYLVQLFVPLTDNTGRPFADEIASIAATLTERFGGVTAFTRSPAEGVWSRAGSQAHDDIVVVEVLCAHLDRPWWRGFRLHLQEILRQESLMIFAQRIERL